MRVCSRSVVIKLEAMESSDGQLEGVERLGVLSLRKFITKRVLSVHP